MEINSIARENTSQLKQWQEWRYGLKLIPHAQVHVHDHASGHHARPKDDADPKNNSITKHVLSKSKYVQNGSSKMYRVLPRVQHQPA